LSLERSIFGLTERKPRETWVERAVGRRHKVAALVAVAAVLAIGALVGLAWTAGFSEVWPLLRHPGWGWLGVALVAEVAAYLGYTLAYREVVRAESGPELEVPKAAALVATGFGVFLQQGGFALDREALRRAGMPEREAKRRVLGLGTLEYALLAPAAVAAASVVLVRGLPVGGSLTLPWVIALPIGATIALTALRFRRRLEGSGRFRRRIGHALRALELVVSMARRPHRHWPAFTGMALYWAGDIACLWATLHAFEARTPPVSQLIVGYATGYALTRRALPLGGAGVVEVLLPFALGWVKIALAPALLAVAAYRTINLWLPMLAALAGLPSLRRLEAPQRRRRQPSTSASS
jgi:putative heme transporter